MSFEKIIGEIYRLKIPFYSVNTSVFLIKQKEGSILVDCATYSSDVDDYIVPALKELNLQLKDVNYLVLTHNHSDHTGGKARILEIAPTIQIVEKVGKQIINGIRTVKMKGHTLDCIGVFDKSTNTLISGDGLQGYGIGKYRCSLASKEEYLKTIANIERNKNIQNILFSHAYEPWYKDSAFGREEVEKCLLDCKNYVLKGE